MHICVSIAAAESSDKLPLKLKQTEPGKLDHNCQSKI
jgi:hypothetical protein